MIRLLLGLILAFFGVSAAAVDCEHHLHHAITNATLRLLERNVLKPADVMEMANSELPFNPLHLHTPVSRDSAAIRFYSQMLSPQVGDHWPRIRSELKTALKQYDTNVVRVDNAKIETEEFVSLREVPQTRSMGWTYDWANVGGKIYFNRLVDREVLVYDLWNHDPIAEVYAAQQEPETRYSVNAKGRPELKIFRLRKTTGEIWRDGGEALLTVDTVDLSTGSVVESELKVKLPPAQGDLPRLAVQIAYPKTTHVDELTKFKVHGRMFDRGEIFTTQSGRKLAAVVSYNPEFYLDIFDYDQKSTPILSVKLGNAHCESDLKFFERNHHLYLLATYGNDKIGDQLALFEPGVSNVPLRSIRIIATGRLLLEESPTGEIFAAIAGSNVRVYSLFAKGVD